MRLCAVMMQRNEGDLFTYWWKFNAAAFGAANLFVLDNLSDDSLTVLALRQAQQCGVNVLYGFHDFERKGEETSRIIRSLAGDYDWFFPMDCDEFVCVRRDDGQVLGPAHVEAELSSRNTVVPRLRVSHYLWNIPHSTQAYHSRCAKVIVGRAQSLNLDHGFHMLAPRRGGSSDLDDRFPPCDICFIHLHNRPYLQLLASSRAKLQHRVANFHPRTLSAYGGRGRHLVPYFFMTEDQYLAELPPGTIDLAPLFAAQGLAVPFSQVRKTS